MVIDRISHTWSNDIYTRKYTQVWLYTTSAIHIIVHTENLLIPAMLTPVYAVHRIGDTLVETLRYTGFAKHRVHGRSVKTVTQSY